MLEHPPPISWLLDLIAHTEFPFLCIGFPPILDIIYTMIIFLNIGTYFLFNISVNLMNFLSNSAYEEHLYQ